MPDFHYKAVSAGGEMVEGHMEATDSSTIIEKLRDQGHFPLAVEEGGRRGGVKSLLQREIFGSRRATQRDLAIATQEFAMLLKAGFPLDRALHVLIDVAEGQALRDLLSRVLERVQGGASLADAIAGDRDSFPRFYAGMVRAGEAGGNLHEVLAQLAGFMERIRTLRETVRSALIYPGILMAMAVMTVIVMFTAVLPKFRPLFEDMGDALPLLTKVFLAIGDAIQDWWWAGTLVLALFAWLFWWRLHDPSFRIRWDAFKLKLPLLGDLLRKVETARFAHTLSMLLRGGQPLLEALGIVQDVIGNTALRAALAEVAGKLRQGQGLSTPLAEAGIFPSLAVHLVHVGEEGGQLESMLEHLAATYDREVRDATQRLISLLVPLLTVFLGTVIALIIMSVLGALLSVNDIVF